VPEIYDHLRPVESSSHEPGIYRVVGTGEEVTLLEVGTAEGRRVHTGRTVRVPASAVEAEFEPVENPDSGVLSRVGEIFLSPFVALAEFGRRLRT